MWFARKHENLTFYARMIFSPKCSPHQYGRGYCCLTDGIDGRRIFICALLQEFVREDPHSMFRKGREEGCFRISVSRYLVDDEKKYREYHRVSQDLFQTILSYIEECVSTVCPRALDFIINEQQQKISNRACSSNWNVPRSRWNLTECIRGENAQHSSLNDPPRKPA